MIELQERSNKVMSKTLLIIYIEQRKYLLTGDFEHNIS